MLVFAASMAATSLGANVLTTLQPASIMAAEEMTDTSRVVDLDEVVVVAQPKEQYRLRQQALSSTVLTAEEMERLHVKDLRQLSLFVPSFVMPAYGARYTSSMYVRGIGSRVNNPAVGVYMDNIPLVSKSMHNMYFYDVDRVDVMRGAQGTLYGQNTEGGLVRLYTRSPLQYEGTDVRVGGGRYVNVEATHYNKVSDRLGFAVGAFYLGQKGFFKNDYTDEYADRSHEAGGKVRLLWRPQEKLTLSLSGDYQWVRQNGFPYGLLDQESGHAAAPATNRQGHYRRHALVTGITADYDAGAFTANYSASWQYLNDQMLMDIDYLPQDFMHMEQGQLQHAMTHELTVKSRNSGRWHWTTGLFFAHQGLKTDAPVSFDGEMNSFLSKTIENYAYSGMLNAMAKRMGQEAAAAMIERAGGCHINMEIGRIPGLFRTPHDNFGVFHESNIDLTERLTATLGLRYDVSREKLSYATEANMRLDESVMGTAVKAVVTSRLARDEHNTFRQLLPKVALSYRIDGSGSRVYATVAKGYRAGGYNFQMFSDILQTELQEAAQTARADMEITHSEQDYSNIAETISYKPEESWNYEVGAHLNLFDGRLHADVAAYYMQIRNQQLSVMAGNYGFGRMMVNAGRSYSCGVELSLRGSALDNHLTWGASYGYTHAVFKDYVDSVKTSGVTTAVDYSGKRVPYVPEHTMSLMADYRVGRWTLGVNMAGQGRTYWDEANSYSQQFYATLGAHVDFLLAEGISFSLWGRNLTDTDYNTFAVGSGATGRQLYFAQRGNPIDVGLDMKLRF